MTASNIIRIDAAAAVKAAREAGNAEHGSHAKLAFALEGVIQQAYEGNLEPAIVIAKQWSEAARKAAAKVLRHFTGGDLKVAAVSDTFKGASLKKGWNDRKVDGWNVAGLSEAALATCPTNSNDAPITHRASLYRMAKALDTPTQRIDTLETIQNRTVKAVAKLDLPGIDDDLTARLIAEAFASIESVSKSFTAKQVADAEVKAPKASKAPRKRRTRKAA